MEREQMFFRGNTAPADPGANTISIESVRMLLANQGVGSVTLRGQPGGFAIVLHIGQAQRLLGTTSGVVRLFSSVAAGSIMLQELGIQRYVVDTTQYSQQSRLRAARFPPQQRVERRRPPKTPRREGGRRRPAHVNHPDGETEIERWLATQAG